MAYKQHANIPAVTKLAGTALTGSYQTIATFQDDVFMLFIFNSCDEPVQISLDGGTTTHFELENESVAVDLRSNEVGFKTPTIQVKALSSVPTSGSVRITAVQNSAGFS